MPKTQFIISKFLPLNIQKKFKTHYLDLNLCIINNSEFLGWEVYITKNYINILKYKIDFTLFYF